MIAFCKVPRDIIVTYVLQLEAHTEPLCESTERGISYFHVCVLRKAAQKELDLLEIASKV